MSELPVISQHAAIMEEPSCEDVSSASGKAHQPVTGTDNASPAVLLWISLPSDKGCSYFC